MKIKLIIAFAILIVFCGCKPSEASMQTAIAQTMQAIQSQTPEATWTPTVTSTFTITPSPTPDIRILDIDPQDYLIKQADLPPEGQYYLPNETWMSIQTNQEIIWNRGTEAGKEYINDIGRIVGWWVDYYKGNNAAQMPQEIYVQVILCQTTAGANLVITKYNQAITNPETNKVVQTNYSIGDNSILTKEENPATNEIWLDLDFTYRNVLVSVTGYGRGDDVQIEFIYNIGNIVLNKLLQVELFNPPTPTQSLLKTNTATP